MAYNQVSIGLGKCLLLIKLWAIFWMDDFRKMLVAIFLAIFWINDKIIIPVTSGHLFLDKRTFF